VRTKLTVVLSTVIVVFALDFWTKRWALRELPGNPQELLDGLIPLTLAFNRGAAFGISIGDDSRWLFIPVTVIALVVLASLMRSARQGDWLRQWSIAFVIAGAVGNLYDRVRWPRGVVDFIGPLDLGFWHFPIFNFADMAISCGAVALAISFWREDTRKRAGKVAEESADEGDGGSADESDGGKGSAKTSEAIPGGGPPARPAPSERRPGRLSADPPSG